jgi:hypothetical protein
MMRRPQRFALPGLIVLGWLVAAGAAWWANRPTPLDLAAPPPRWVSVAVPPGSPAGRDWPHFLACSGLSSDPALMRSTLVLNDGGDPQVWRLAAAQATPIRVALAPVGGALSPSAEQIIGDAPRAVADCGDVP